MDRRVQLERILQAQFLADLAHRGHDLLAQEADACLGVLVADVAVITPQPVNAGAGLFEHAAQFRDHGLWRPVNDPAVGHLLLEGRAAARTFRPSDRKLDKLAAKFRREIARWVRPYRM